MKENKLTCKLLRKYTVYYYVSLSNKEPNEIHQSIHIPDGLIADEGNYYLTTHSTHFIYSFKASDIW